MASACTRASAERRPLEMLTWRDLVGGRPSRSPTRPGAQSRSWSGRSAPRHCSLSTRGARRHRRSSVAWLGLAVGLGVGLGLELGVGIGLALGVRVRVRVKEGRGWGGLGSLVCRHPLYQLGRE